LLDELPNGKIRFSQEFSKYHWELIEKAAEKLGYFDAEEMFIDAELGQLARVGINPPQDWV